MIEPKRLERWNCIVAMVADPDGHNLEIIQNDG